MHVDALQFSGSEAVVRRPATKSPHPPLVSVFYLSGAMQRLTAADAMAFPATT